MAAIDFPNNPTVGQVFTSGSRSWVWTGTVWDAKPYGLIPQSDVANLTSDLASKASASEIISSFLLMGA